MTRMESERMAVVEIEVKHCTRRLDENSNKLAEMDKKLDEMIALFNQAKGARWVIVAAASLAGGAVAFLMKLIPFGGLPR